MSKNKPYMKQIHQKAKEAYLEESGGTIAWLSMFPNRKQRRAFK